jgi:hypothetical protein
VPVTGIEPITALPWVNWIFWGVLGSGTIAVVGGIELTGGTTTGYRRFMAWLGVGFAAIWWLSDRNLPESGLSHWENGVAAFALASAAYLVASMLRWPRSGLALAAGAVGLATTASLAFGESNLWVVQLWLAAAALGAVNAAMLLGHWYLVTPQLSPTPLRRMMVVLLVALVLQLAAFGIALVGADADAWSHVAWLVWMCLIVGILLPIGITVLAWIATRAASLQASTGLLYIALAFVITGTIGGASLTFWTGVPL